MKSRLSWTGTKLTLTSIGLIALTACAIAGPYDAPRGQRNGSGLAGYTFTGPQSKQRFGQLREEEDPSKAAYNLFCSQGKQRRALLRQVLFPVPASPKGLPVDVANKIRSTIMERARKAVTHYFEWASLGADTFNTACTLPTSDQAKLIEMLKGDSYSPRIVGQLLHDDANHDQNFNPIPDGTPWGKFFVVNAGDRAILASDKLTGCYTFADTHCYGHPTEWIDARGKSACGKSDGRDPFESDYQSPRFFRLDPPVPFHVARYGKSGRERDDDVTEAPLRPIALRDLLSLREGYTLLPPTKLYWKLINHDGKVYDGDLRHEVSVSDALQNRELLWLGYFRDFTQVTEAPGKEPGTEVFEVSLDLNPLCQYGRPIRDLTSQ